jgi:Ala-tRNA(Pro) deacylase
MNICQLTLSCFEKCLRSMPATRADLFRRLEDLGIKTTTVEHPAVFTVAESDQLHRDLPGGHTKNLFLKDAKDKLWLVVAEHHTPVDLKALHKQLGAARFSFGKAELLGEVLGVTPGSVTALALINDPANRISVVVDAALMRYEVINCHPLENTATTAIGRDDLLKFMRASGHEPRIVEIAAPSP